MITRSESPDIAYSEVLQALAHRRRRSVLRVLERATATEIDDLARRVVSDVEEEVPADRLEERVRSVRSSLAHHHLPILESAGMVGLSEGVVSVARHPAFQEPTITSLRDVETDDWDEVLAAIADDERRIALTTLAERRSGLSRRELARAIESRLDDAVDCDRLERRLRHVHVPKLDHLGLVDHDPERDRIEFVGHPELDEAWLAQLDSPPEI